jgi:O-antigen ligase
VSDGTAIAAGLPADRCRGAFPFATTRLARLPLVFWAFQAYLFLTFSAIDEEWRRVGALRPRLVLACLILLALGGRLLSPSPWSDGPRPWRPRMPAAPGAVWLGLFLGAGVLSVLWAYDGRLAWPVMVETATRIALFFVALLVLHGRRQVLLTLLVVVAAHAFYLLRSFTEYLAGRHDFTMGVKRMLGAGTSTADPNSFAATVVFAVPLVVWVLVETRARWLRFCTASYLLLGAICVVLARSRSGLVLLVLASLWTLFQVRGRARALLLLSLGVFAVVMAGRQTDAAKERFLGLLDPSTLERDPSAHGRIEGYEVSWDIFVAHPLLGVGPGNWAAYRAQRVDGNRHEPHNLAGQLLATQGLAGTIPFLLYLLASVTFALRVRRRGREAPSAWVRADARLGSVVAFTLLLLLVSGLGAHNLDRHAWYLLPALLAALPRPREEDGRGAGASRPASIPIDERRPA